MKRQVIVGAACLLLLGLSVSSPGQNARTKREVDDWTVILKSAKDANRRAEAIAKLAEIAGVRAAFVKTAVPAVVEALKDNAVEVRRTAAQAVAVMAPDPKTATPLLANLLEDNDRDTRVAAALALGYLGKGAAEALPKLTAARDRENGRAEKDNDFLNALNRAVVTLQLSASKLGPWYYAGPFDNANNQGFRTAFPPEKEIDLKKKYKGKGGEDVAWRTGTFTDGEVNNLALFDEKNNSSAVIYLYREIEAEKAMQMALSFGSDDTLSVWVNGERIINEEVFRGAAADQNLATVKLKEGKNALLIKICQGEGDWAFYFAVKGVNP